MSWKRHFRIVKQTPSVISTERYGASTGTSSNFSSYLPLVYAGHPNRIQRYYQFDDMDRDSDVNAALDTIADFSTQSEEHAEEPFEFKFHSDPNESEVKILKTMMAKWVKLNNFRARLWYMFRDTLKNGDAFFLRDPETQEWLWLDHFMVEMVKVDDTMGKKPDEYLIRGLDLNRQTKFGSKQADPNQYRTPYGTSNVGASRVSSVSASSGPAAFSLAGSAADPRQRHMLGPFSQEVSVVDAEYVIHLSLSIGNDINWPFGTSILEPIFKVFKQKELLEDAIIIYRVQRAPERRIFYIDTGTMPPERAKRHIEAIKNDIHQRRIPNRTGTGGNILDAAYNPLSINDDYFLAMCLLLDTRIVLLDGRTLTLNEIIAEHEQGKQNWVYSLNTQTHELEPGRIVWAGPTRRNAELVRVTLDNGEHIDATPDHRFILRDGSEIEAAQLQSGDSLMPLYLREGRTGPRQKNAGYRRYLCNATSKTKFVHTTICPKPLGREWVVHHKDFDGMNNNPDNLAVMRWHDHEELHKNAGTYSLGKQWATAEGREKLIEGMKRNFAEATPEEQAARQLKCRTNGAKTWADPEKADKLRIVLGANARKQAAAKRLQFTIDMFERTLFLYNQGHNSVKKICKILRADEAFQSLYREANANVLRGVQPIGTVDDGTLNKIVATAGYTSWGDFKNNYANNHKVVSVERLPDRADTGDITIESPSGSHVFALAAGVYVHNSSDGRGSKVETLPGGECLALDTMINLQDGRTLSLQEIIHEYEDGKTLWAVSCDPWTGSLAPGLISWAGVTRRNTQVVRLTLANGEAITVTPDHKFPVDGRGKVEAKDLTSDDMLFGYIPSIHKDIGVAEMFEPIRNPYRINITNIEWLDEPQDTGTLTIDGHELFHDYHTFAVNHCVFVMNSVGEIQDLMYFTRKIARGLRVPTSYINLGDGDEGQSVTFNDGKLGAALIQEYRFTKYCMRWQALLGPIFDKEYKRFLIKNGIEMDWGLFELQFRPPQSFTKYRQIELDAQSVQVYQGVAENKRLSERFKLKRFLGLSEDEMIENEKLWSEENAEKLKKKTGSSPSDQPVDGLSAVGVRPMGDEMPPDMPEGGEEMPPEGGPEGAAPGGGGMPAPPPAGAAPMGAGAPGGM